jgi:hypothetical protein
MKTEFNKNEKLSTEQEASPIANVLLGAVVFSNVRESKLKKSMRKRQCFKCEGKIEKGETYMNHQFRYDYRIITVSFCNNCT